MSETLKKITARAKQIRKAHPAIKWTDAIKKASAELKRTGKISSPKKTVYKKTVSRKRVGVVKAPAKNISVIPGSLAGMSEQKLLGAIKERVNGTMGKAYIKLHHAKTAKEKRDLKKIISECKRKLNKLK